MKNEMLSLKVDCRNVGAKELIVNSGSFGVRIP